MNGKIFLVNPVILRELNGRFGLDDQTCEGLKRWSENFDQVIFACIVLPEDALEKTGSSVTGTNWQAIADLPFANKIEFVHLPWAYRVQDFIKVYPSTRKLLAEKIAESQYLCFSIWSLIGDWGAVACQEAMKQKRAYSVWTDWVAYEVMSRLLPTFPWKRRIKEFLTIPLMRLYHKYLIQNSDLGLFQGQDCYLEFSRFSKNPHCVYDVHTQKSDQINPSELQLKIDSAQSGKPLLICYAGRVADEKGPIDWLYTLHYLQQQGVNFQATWIGNGPLLTKMQLVVQELGIASCVKLTGFISDRSQILQIMRTSHIFLFCHKTPESPRCLVESLVSACPLVGYDSPYPVGLVGETGGGVFAPMNDWRKLAEELIKLNGDRDRLIELIYCANISGQRFDEETVYQARANLIKEYIN